MQLSPVRRDEALQGRILQTLLDGSASTSQLAQYHRRKLSLVRRELIHLHQLGVIRIVASRSVEGQVPAKSYFQDYIWAMTTHGLEHANIDPRCFACTIRGLRLLRAGGVA